MERRGERGNKAIQLTDYARFVWACHALSSSEGGGRGKQVHVAGGRGIKEGKKKYKYNREGPFPPLKSEGGLSPSDAGKGKEKEGARTGVPIQEREKGETRGKVSRQGQG